MKDIIQKVKELEALVKENSIEKEDKHSGQA